MIVVASKNGAVGIQESMYVLQQGGTAVDAVVAGYRIGGSIPVHNHSARINIMLLNNLFNTIFIKHVNNLERAIVPVINFTNIGRNDILQDHSGSH